MVISLVALLPRLFVAIAWAREPVWDGHYYHFGATRIADGLGYSEDVIVGGQAVWKAWCHYPVGYSGLLGVVYKVVGSGTWVAPVLNAIVGAATVFVAHRLARYYLSTNRARLAGGLAALHPGLIAYSAVVMTEPLAAFLTLLAGYLAVRAKRRVLAVVLAGIVLGLATLVRPSSLLAAPLVLVALPKPAWKAALGGLLATATAVLVVSPWSYRNCRVMDDCAFVSTNGGWNLAIGALTKTGRFTTLRAADGCAVVTGQVQQDRCWAKVGVATIRANPTRWLGHTYDHESFPIEYLREADREAWPESRRVAARHLLSNFHRLLLVLSSLSVVGFIGWNRRRRLASLSQTLVLTGLFILAAIAVFSDQHPFFWLAVATPLIALFSLAGAPKQGRAGRYLLGLLFATTLTHAVFFGDDRYHMVIAPVFCILAAGALRDQRARRAVD